MNRTRRGAGVAFACEHSRWDHQEKYPSSVMGIFLGKFPLGNENRRVRWSAAKKRKRRRYFLFKQAEVAAQHSRWDHLFCFSQFDILSSNFHYIFWFVIIWNLNCFYILKADITIGFYSSDIVWFWPNQTIFNFWISKNNIF